MGRAPRRPALDERLRRRDRAPRTSEHSDVGGFLWTHSRARYDAQRLRLRPARRCLTIQFNLEEDQ
jgi:hypothetical protein